MQAPPYYAVVCLQVGQDPQHQQDSTMITYACRHAHAMARVRGRNAMLEHWKLPNQQFHLKRSGVSTGATTGIWMNYGLRQPHQYQYMWIKNLLLACANAMPDTWRLRTINMTHTSGYITCWCPADTEEEDDSD